MLIATVVITAWFGPVIMPSAGSFHIVLSTIFILHGLMPLPMHICFMLSVATSIIYEVCIKYNEYLIAAVHAESCLLPGRPMHQFVEMLRNSMIAS